MACILRIALFASASRILLVTKQYLPLRERAAIMINTSLSKLSRIVRVPFCATLKVLETGRAQTGPATPDVDC